MGHLLRESPYTLKMNSAGQPSAAKRDVSDSLAKMDTHSYGKSKKDITNWISKMVNLHLDVPKDSQTDDTSSEAENVDYEQMYGDDNNEESSFSERSRQMSFPATLRNSAVS